jgi:2-polyprenyl-6-methoxyphenol hydroxylase-like FAD-dependent oxidoreductase
VTDASRTVRCVVVGGSLVGLSTAIALAGQGMDVTVLEQSPSPAADAGGGLGVDVALLQEVTGIRDEPPVLHGIDRDTTAWHLLQGWLEEHAARCPAVAMRRAVRVTAATSGDQWHGATVLTADSSRYPADLVIGADGARSTVRAAVAPDNPAARYAGVLLWRALVGEQDMPPAVSLPAAGEPGREVYAGPYRLVTYPVPGPAGETTVGDRRLNLVWYDPQQRELLLDAGLLDGETVRGSLAPGALPGGVQRRLSEFAAANWPSPWREALAIALDGGTVFGTPIVHYKPAWLTSGRLALAGDAAHAASPMVGGGFREGLYDARALALTMRDVSSAGEVPGALARYQGLRLRPAIQHVARSEQATADYLAHAGA